MRVIVIEDDDDKDIKIPFVHRPGRRGFDYWVCLYCGKRVYSMEVHPCNQPWCGRTGDDGWFPGGAAWDECNLNEIPKWEDKSGDRG